MNSQAFYITKLKQVFSEKQRKNSHYSLRAFSRDIGMDSSSLGKIIKGERRFPVNKAETVSKKLDLTPTDKRLFFESISNKENVLDKIMISKEDERHLIDESCFKVLAEWEHYAVLELFDFKDFEVDTESISKKLDISLTRADVVLTNLFEAKLISSENGCLYKIHEDVKTTEDISSQALRKSHVETLEVGIIKLEEVDIDLRDYSSMTVAVDLDKISEAKEVIREFRRKMSTLFSEGNKSEVYNLAIQLYPLSHINNKGEHQ
jgi:uncharacterized protein (TIGR02147 family)